MVIRRFEVPDYVRSVLICDPTDIWGNVVGIGLNELIASLTPAKRYDRRGNVIFQDSFENGLSAWEHTAGGTSAEVVASTSYSSQGGISAKLTAGSDGNHNAFIYRKMPYPILTKWGLECMFKLFDYCQDFGVRLYRYDGTNIHCFILKYDHANTRVQIWGSDGNYVTVISSINLETTYGPFHWFKLVVDLETDEYVRCMVNNNEVDVSAYSARLVADTDIPHMRPDIIYHSTLGYVGTGYVDSVILTQNEPA